MTTMRAVVYDRFGERPVVRDVPAPVPGPLDAVLAVEASGLCRSDWHAWAGHDDTVALPHVPGHEVVGRVVAVGGQVRGVAVGERVTTPFVCACGECPTCLAGDGQVCPHQTQPGFTHPGSFAEQVLVHRADTNLVAVGEDVDAGAAALLGCRFATSYRALTRQAQLAAGEVVLVLGCGGVGLSAVMIAVALGARVVAVDVAAAALARARDLGAEAVVDVVGAGPDEAAQRVAAAAAGLGRPDGVEVAVEALGREDVLALGVRSLARHGRLVQVGLFAQPPRVPMGDVVARELRLVGSHGMAARDYPELLDLVTRGALRPERLVTARIGLDAAPDALMALGGPASGPGGVVLVVP